MVNIEKKVEKKIGYKSSVIKRRKRIFFDRKWNKWPKTVLTGFRK